MSDDAIVAYLKERDEVLMSGNIDRLIAFQNKHNPSSPFRNREIAEVSLHKSRTAVQSLPMEYRLASKRWLSERGYHSLDDGDLS